MCFLVHRVPVASSALSVAQCVPVSVPVSVSVSLKKLDCFSCESGLAGLILSGRRVPFPVALVWCVWCWRAFHRGIATAICITVAWNHFCKDIEIHEVTVKVLSVDDELCAFAAEGPCLICVTYDD